MRVAYAKVALLSILIIAFSYIGLGIYFLSRSNPYLSIRILKTGYTEKGLTEIFVTEINFTENPLGFFRASANATIFYGDRVIGGGFLSKSLGAKHLKLNFTVLMPYEKLGSECRGFCLSPLYNDSTLKVTLGIGMDNFLISITHRINMTFNWGAPFSNLKITVVKREYNTTHSKLLVRVGFENHSNIDFNGTIKVVMNSSSRVIENSTEVSSPSGSSRAAYIELIIPRGLKAPMEVYIIPDVGGKIGPVVVGSVG